MTNAWEVIGTDVSHWQNRVYENGVYVNKPIDWGIMKQHAQFVYIKATDSKTYTDPAFIMNWDGAHVSGMPRGAYHFMRAHEVQSSAKKQAQNFWNAISSDPGELTPMLDVEQNTDNLKKSELQDFIWKFILNFRELSGIDIGVYTSKGFWDWNVASSPGNTDIPRLMNPARPRHIWVANYRELPPPAIPWDWETRYGNNCYKFWQWTMRGDAKLHGAHSTYIDLNRYNGTIDQFNAEFGTDIGEPTDPPVPPIDPPPVDVDAIEIVGVGVGTTLRLRGTPAALPDLSNVVGQTWDGVLFIVMGSDSDSLGRTWYQIGESIWVAGWYTKPV